MSVDFFDCTVCGTSVCECGDYEFCEICEYKFCTECYPNRVHEADFIKRPALEPEQRIQDVDGKFQLNGEREIDHSGLERARKDACPLCSLKVITDEMLVYFLLGKCKMTRKQAEKAFRKAAKTS